MTEQKFLAFVYLQAGQGASHRRTCGCQHAGVRPLYQDLPSHPDIWTSSSAERAVVSMTQRDPTLPVQLSARRACVLLHWCLQMMPGHEHIFHLEKPVTLFEMECRRGWWCTLLRANEALECQMLHEVDQIYMRTKPKPGIRIHSDEILPLQRRISYVRYLVPPSSAGSAIVDDKPDSSLVT